MTAVSGFSRMAVGVKGWLNANKGSTGRRLGGSSRPRTRDIYGTCWTIEKEAVFHSRGSPDS
jgi:hypothetical protein